MDRLNMNIKIKKLDSDAVVPQYQTPGAACFDLHATHCATISPGSPMEICTSLAFEVPEDHVMLIFSRSGHGFNAGVRLANCVGVIDSDYRHEVLVKLHCDSPYTVLKIKKGDRVAQAMVLPVNQITFEVVDELSTTQRNGGFGSTGA